jgi:hypothetical protein
LSGLVNVLTVVVVLPLSSSIDDGEEINNASGGGIGSGGR